MNGQSGRMNSVADFVGDFTGIHRAARQVRCIFQLHQSCLWAVIASAAYVRRDHLPVQDAVLGMNAARQAAGKRRHRGHLEIEDVRAVFANHFLPVMRVNFDGRLVAHASRGNEQARLALENLRRALLQAIDGRVLAVNVVTHFRLGHGASHSGRRPCHGVTA